MEFYIGTSGWSYKHWKGIFYTDNLSEKEWLRFYSDSFNSVEVNMTFYRYPREIAVRNWGERTPDDFVFTLKAPQVITHLRRLGGIEGSLYRLYDLMDILGDKGRSVLFQMPPSFHLTPENIKRVDSLLKLLDDRYDHAIEFRHKSWWCDECYDLLHGRCGFCCVDGLGMPREIIATNRVLYMRFHGGYYNRLYNDHEIAAYAGRILEVAGVKNVKRVYIYFNNDYNGYAVRNAASMKTMISGMVNP